MRNKGIYEKYFKRPLDFTLSLGGIALLSPVYIALTATGAIAMKGNPFFAQKRPGINEEIFSIIKYRTMTNERDAEGNLLPDDVRLNKYGKFLRSTSLDELPELFNVVKGDMSLVGPRPLLVEYLPWYSETEKIRHKVRPGITGLAQVMGRNTVEWGKRLAYDVEYVNKISFTKDVEIIFKTLEIVMKRKGVQVDTADEGNLAEIRKGMHC